MKLILEGLSIQCLSTTDLLGRYYIVAATPAHLDEGCVTESLVGWLKMRQAQKLGQKR